MKIYLLAILAVLCIGSVSAIIITPNPANFSVQVNTAKSYSITVKNDLTFPIMDLTFSNLTDFKFDNITVISPNETKTIPLTITAPQSFSGIINSKVQFKYIVDIPQAITTYYVNITEQGFSPSILNIRQGDSVIWTNKDDITHTVTSAKFDLTTLPNQTAQYTFNTIETVEYQDLILFFGGTVNVINRTAPNKVYNPDYDKTWNVNYIATSNPTTLDFSTLESAYTVSATGSVEGMSKIKNIGSIKAEKVHLSSSNWITFDENDFDLLSSATKYVKYTISPFVTSENETDKNYTLDLIAHALNTNSYSTNISVYIPFSTVFSNKSNSDEAFILWFTNVFCPQNPNLFICNTSRADTANSPQIIYRDPTIPVNLTASEVYAMLKRLQRIEDSNARTDNKLKEVADQLGITIPELMTMLNQSYSKQVDNERTQAGRWDAVWILGFFVLASVCTWAIFFYIRKYNYKRRMLEGKMA